MKIKFKNIKNYRIEKIISEIKQLNLSYKIIASEKNIDEFYFESDDLIKYKFIVVQWDSKSKLPDNYLIPFELEYGIKILNYSYLPDGSIECIGIFYSEEEMIDFIKKTKIDIFPALICPSHEGVEAIEWEFNI